MRRRRAVASALGIAAVMAGCGDSSSDDETGSSDPCAPENLTWVYSRITEFDDPSHPSEVFRLDDGAETQLTDAAAPPEREASSAAAVSPDGSQIVFERGSEGDPESAGYTRHRLYVMASDGSDAQPLFDPANEPPDADLAWDTNPVWSPDGSQIAFVRNVMPRFGSDAGSIHSVMVAPAEGGQPKAVSSDGSDLFDPAPAWSADGTRLAWVNEESSSLHWSTVDGEDAGSLRLPELDGAPAWAGNGREILVGGEASSPAGSASSVYRVVAATGEHYVVELPPLTDLWALPTGELATSEPDGEKASTIVVLDPGQPEERTEIADVDNTIEGLVTAVPDDPDGWAACTGA